VPLSGTVNHEGHEGHEESFSQDSAGKQHWHLEKEAFVSFVFFVFRFLRVAKLPDVAVLATLAR
jgi:hypothetical protein